MASQEPQRKEPEVKARPTLMSTNTRNLIVGTAIVIILLTVTAMAGSVNTERAKKEALLYDVNALAASFKYPIMEANSLRTDAGRERLDPMLKEVAKAGGYSSMVLTNEVGDVLASTKGSLEWSTVPVGTLPKDGARVGRTSVTLEAAAPIKMNESTIGYLFVETDR
jgi:hypothetical protein